MRAQSPAKLSLHCLGRRFIHSRLKPVHATLLPDLYDSFIHAPSNVLPTSGPGNRNVRAIGRSNQRTLATIASKFFSKGISQGLEGSRYGILGFKMRNLSRIPFLLAGSCQSSYTISIIREGVSLDHKSGRTGRGTPRVGDRSLP